ncbi:MAG: hypothetical protein P8100_07530 [bacterium]|jgi:hypothetical protein
MGLFNRKKKAKSDTKPKESTLRQLFDDITTLEINTIIKRGMVAAPMPQSIEETLQHIFIEYKRRLRIIFNTYDLNIDDYEIMPAMTVADFHAELKKFAHYMQENNFKLAEKDYVRFLRMLSFCEYIYSKSDDSKPDDNIEIKDLRRKEVREKSKMAKTVYHLDMSDYTQYRLIMFVSDTVKIKRMFDLGTENIVLQTRFSLDGDVVTRIEEGFAQQPKEVVLRIHDKQTDITVNYWKSLIGMVKDFVNEFIS